MAWRMGGLEDGFQGRVHGLEDGRLGGWDAWRIYRPGAPPPYSGNFCIFDIGGGGLIGALAARHQGWTASNVDAASAKMLTDVCVCRVSVCVSASLSACAL